MFHSINQHKAIILSCCKLSKMLNAQQVVGKQGVLFLKTILVMHILLTVNSHISVTFLSGTAITIT